MWWLAIFFLARQAELDMRNLCGGDSQEGSRKCGGGGWSTRWLVVQKMERKIKYTRHRQSFLARRQAVRPREFVQWIV